MNSKTLLALMTAAGLAFSSLAAAQAPGPNGPNGPNSRGGAGWQNGNGPGGPGGHGGPGGPGAQGGPGRPGGQPMHADHGPGPGGPNFRRGERLPNDYRNRQYVVDDWRGYNLNRPPRGYHWVGVNGDYLLVAITSGVIAQIITGGR